jgi:hypothetical protein
MIFLMGPISNRVITCDNKAIEVNKEFQEDFKPIKPKVKKVSKKTDKLKPKYDMDL